MITTMIVPYVAVFMLLRLRLVVSNLKGTDATASHLNPHLARSLRGPRGVRAAKPQFTMSFGDLPCIHSPEPWIIRWMTGCRVLTVGGAAVGPRLAGATIGITPEGLSVFQVRDSGISGSGSEPPKLEQ